MLLTERFHEKKLKNLNINIITEYLDDGIRKIRNSDNSSNQDVTSGIRINKKYIKDGLMVHQEKEFNPRILYSYIAEEELDKEYKCKNCGATFTPRETTICPYCRSNYNIDYTDKELSARYHCDRIIRSNKYVVITFIIDFLICELASFLYFINTGRTFMIFDMLKAFGFGLIFTLILFYVLYTLDAVIISLPVKMIKDKENKKKIEIWKKLEELGVEKREFFNNFNSSLDEHYYKLDNDVIDYDVLDYSSYDYFFDNKKRLNVKVTLIVRLEKCKGKVIKGEEITDTLILRKNEIDQEKLEQGLNFIKCHKCGASIDAAKHECEFCKSPVHYLQSWYIVEE